MKRFRTSIKVEVAELDEEDGYITSGMLHWNWNIPIRMKHNRLIGGD